MTMNKEITSTRQCMGCEKDFPPNEVYEFDSLGSGELSVACKPCIMGFPEELKNVIKELFGDGDE